MNINLTWDKKFNGKVDKMFEEMQTYIDKECLDRMMPFVPVGLPRYRNSGKLKNSGAIESPGCIVFTSQNARHDYYSTVDHRHGGNKQAKRLWFEVMKSKDQKNIAVGLGEIARRFCK